MRTFRFSKLTISLMIACFIAISGAIGLAAEISRRITMGYQDGAPSVFTLFLERLPVMFVTGLLMFCIFGAIGYGFLFVSGRTGFQRISKLDTHPSQGR